MKTRHLLLLSVRPLLTFMLVLTSTASCTLINEISIDASSIDRSNTQYKILIKKRMYTEYLFDFVTTQDQLILADMGEVEIFDLKTGASILNRKVFEDWVESVHITKDQTRLYLFTQNNMQLWDTQDWLLLKALHEDKHAEKITAFSKDESLLFFASQLWSTENFESIYDIGNSAALTGTAFSPDNQYFVDTDHHFGMSVIDIKNHEWTGISYLETGFSMADFRDNESFFAGYGARIDLDRGGYFAKALGVFSAIKKDQLESFNPHEKITCWTHAPGYGVLASLYDGDIYLLDDNLDIQFKWHMDDFARSCTLAKPGEIWLGGEKTGLYRADLKNRRITHEYQTEGPIYTLKISDDGRYIGFVEQPTAEQVITVLSPVTR